MLTQRRGGGCLAASRPKPGKGEGRISWGINRSDIHDGNGDFFLPDRRSSSLNWHLFVPHSLLLLLMIQGRSILGRSIARCGSAMASR